MDRLRFYGVVGKDHLGSSEFTFDVRDGPATLKIDGESVIVSFEDRDGANRGTESFLTDAGFNIRCINFQDPMGAGMILERLFKIDGVDIDLYMVVQSIGLLRKVSVTLMKRIAK